MWTSGADVAILVALETPFSGVEGDDGGVLLFGAFLVLMELVSELVFHCFGVIQVLIGPSRSGGAISVRVGACIDGRLGDDAVEVSDGVEEVAGSGGLGSEGVEDLILVGNESS